MKLSIVIPVYNVERYISKCIDSCYNQDLPHEEYEIIIINDGSTDRSLDIVNKSCLNKSNIKVYSQNNQGLSVARNAGFSRASGEYVWFVDSDDYLEPNSLLGVCSYLKEKVDILQIQYRYVYESNGSFVDAKKTIIDGVKTGVEVLVAGGLDIPAQFSIYRREFLLENNLEFYPHIFHEDVEFKPRAVYFACSIMSYPNVVYNYLQREGSITANKVLKNALDLLIVSDNLYAQCSFIKREAIPYFSTVIACAVNWVFIIMNNLTKEERQRIFDNLRTKRYLFKKMTSSSKRKYRYEGYLLLLSIRLGRWLYLKIR